MTDNPISTDAKRLVLEGFWTRRAEAEEVAGVNCFRRAGEYRALAKSLVTLLPEAVEEAYAMMVKAAEEQAGRAG